MTDQALDNTGGNDQNIDGQATDQNQQQGQANDQGQTGAQQQGQASNQGQQGQANNQGQNQGQQAAPESYTDFELPDGVKLNPEIDTEFKSLAKEIGLSQDNAQKVAAVGAKMAQQFENQVTDAIKSQQTAWLEELRNDKDLGGDNFDESIGIANKAFDTFGSPELKEFLQKSGAGNHPALVRWAYKVGKAISEDTLVNGQQGGQAPDPLTKLYPSMAQKQ